MFKITPNSGRGHEWWPRAAVCAGLVCLAGLLAPSGATAQEQPGDEGIFITVQKPITSAVVDYIKAKTERALQRKIRTIVYDFNPGRHVTGTDEYGPCRDLAAVLSHVQVNTVAFVHRDATKRRNPDGTEPPADVAGHRLLPVLACKEIVMSDEARLGNDLLTKPEALDEDQKHFYRQIAGHWGKSRAAVILKMLDPNLEVFEGTWQGAIAYFSQAEAPGGFVKRRAEPLLPAGMPGNYSARKAQEFGLCKLIRNTREEVKDAYDLKPSSLREDPLEGREPKAVRFVINESVTPEMREHFTRRVRQAVGEHANFIIVQLECGGGDPLVALDLARFLRDLHEEDDQGRFPVMTIAYIPKNAPGAATILALGCMEIVMEKKDDKHQATIGDLEQIYKGHEDDPDSYKPLREGMMDLAAEQGYSPLLVRGMLDRSVEIYEVRSLKGRSERKLITREEWEADQAGPKDWGRVRDGPVKAGGPAGKFLTLTAEQAKDFNLARHTVTGYEDLKAIYGLANVREARLDFLYYVADFLRLPVVKILLIMIGITCLILEMKMPGVSLPGVIAAICFVLYFWAQSQLSGQIIMLAILLFILGLLLIALEVFVIPGFGVPGITGVILVLISLALAALEKKPETSQEWMSFARMMGLMGLSLVGAIAMAFVLARYLPVLPWAHSLVLRPPAEASVDFDEDTPADAGHPGGQPEMAALLGAIGVAATTLRPSGIARIGEAFVDVVSEGSFIQAGTRVQVIEIEGNRIVVKEV
jgi:membrane-bound serine protease (ClpP class)